MAGVEGYVESAALGFLAGMGAARAARGEEPVLPPRATAHGSLLAHLGDANPKHFQPMNVNYGLFPPLPPPEPVPGQRRTRKRSKREKNQALAHRALENLEPWRDAIAPTREAGR
jgi:methylenetetrahydrofolate--tRNA-(uracil-5-)-methyltransferase